VSTPLDIWIKLSETFSWDTFSKLKSGHSEQEWDGSDGTTTVETQSGTYSVTNHGGDELQEFFKILSDYLRTIYEQANESEKQITDFGQNAQITFDGKIYEAEIQVSDKTMKNGCCLIYTYCILTFEKDSVLISYRREAHCNPSHLEANYKNLNEQSATEKKKYLYTATNKTVRIENFQRYDFLPEQMLILTIENNGERLIAKEEKKMETLNGVFHFKGLVQENTEE
jgi:hypothetical protein